MLTCVEGPLLTAVQGAAAKAKAEKMEAAQKEMAELMVQAQAKMDKDKEGAEAAKAQADELQKEVPYNVASGTVAHLQFCAGAYPLDVIFLSGPM